MGKLRSPKNLVEFKNIKYPNIFVDQKKLKKEFSDNNKIIKEAIKLKRLGKKIRSTVLY